MQRKQTAGAILASLSLGVAIGATALRPSFAQPPATNNGGGYGQQGGQGAQQQGGQRQGPPPSACPNGQLVGPALGGALGTLNLSTDQQTAILAALEAERTLMDQLHAKTHATVDSNLTDAQRKQLAALEQQFCSAQNGQQAGQQQGGQQSGGQQGNQGGQQQGGQGGSQQGGQQQGGQGQQQGGGQGGQQSGSQGGQQGSQGGQQGGGQQGGQAGQQGNGGPFMRRGPRH